LSGGGGEAELDELDGDGLALVLELVVGGMDVGVALVGFGPLVVLLPAEVGAGAVVVGGAEVLLAPFGVSFHPCRLARSRVTLGVAEEA